MVLPMKKLILSLSLFVSFPIFACPVLTGKYTCSSRNGSVDIELKNLGNNRFQLEDPPIVTADGQKQVAEGMGFIVETTAKCDSRSLQVIQEVFSADSKEFLSQLVKIYTPLVSGNLAMWINDTNLNCVRR